jgi:radical SAM protein with 4Fe4S-binding SPASM domain
MSSLTLHLESRLARAVRTTGRWNSAPMRFRPLRAAAKAVDFIARAAFHVWRNHRYLSVRKLANMALVNAQFRFKTERVVGRPYRMKIESTNICNTKCQLCPTGIGLVGRPRGKMDLDGYKRLIDRTAWHLMAVDLSMWGDPLIVPEIYDMIRHAHDKGVWTYISSNLHAFKLDAAKGQAEAMVKSGLDMLTVSLHGASQATFEAYQPGKSFEEAVAKVRHIVAVRDRMRSRTPDVQLNFVVLKQNEHERDAFERLAAELGCKAVFSTPAMNVRFLGRDKNLVSLNLAPDVLAKRTQEHLDRWLPDDKRHVLAPYRAMRDGALDFEQFNGHKPFNCSWPWQAAVVNWDGQVVTCCGSFDPAEDMGSVFDQPFGKIWNSEKYRMARRSFKRKLDDAQAKDNPCATCPGFML